MNGTQGIQPVVELATNNGNAYPYPVYPAMGGFGGNGFGNSFGGDGALWIILIIALLGGFGNGNNGWGGFGGNSFDNSYAWLSNGQKEIMSNTNNGFDTLHLSNQVEGVRDGIHDIQNAICSSTANINSNVSNGFYGAEISANNRQLSFINSLNDINTSLLNCCCENRLATCQTQNIVQNEGNQTRFADANNTRDIIAKNDRIADLQREISMKDLAASQIAQNAFISQGFANEVDALYNRLNSCPVPSTPVFGRTPIFTCNNNGCGCNGYNNLI